MMSDEELISIIQPYYREILDKKDLVLKREISANDIDTWDSLNHILLIVKCEEIFKLKFKANELVKLKNLGDFLDLIKTKL